MDEVDAASDPTSHLESSEGRLLEETPFCDGSEAPSPDEKPARRRRYVGRKAKHTIQLIGSRDRASRFLKEQPLGILEETFCRNGQQADPDGCHVTNVPAPRGPTDLPVVGDPRTLLSTELEGAHPTRLYSLLKR